MNENATFFRHRRNDSGATYQFAFDTPHGSQGFAVYCRRPVQSKLFSETAPPKDAANFSKKLHDVVTTKGGGGVIVTVAGENGRRVLDVQQLGDAAPARRLVILTPGAPAELVPIAAKHKLLPGTHAIVPVDAKAEEQLASFVDQLPWFPPDFETLVLNTMRRPSLDARLSNVETRVFGQSQEEPLPRRGWPQLKLRLQKALSKPAPYAIAAVVLLTLLLGGNGYLLWDLRSRVEKIAAPSGAVTHTDTAGKTPKDQPVQSSSAPAQSPFVVKTTELLQALRESKNANITAIYNDHFTALNDQLTDEMIRSWFDGAESARPVARGILKLQALAIHPANSNFVNDDDARAAINIIKQSKDSQAIHLASVLACRLGTAAKTGCEKLKDDEIANRLTALVDFVKKQQ